MNLEVRNVKEYGFAKLRQVFDSNEVSDISNAVFTYSKKFTEGIVFEEGLDVNRAIHGPHLYDPFFKSRGL